MTGCTESPVQKITPEELGIPELFSQPRRMDVGIGMVGFGGIARAHIADYRKTGLNIAAVADVSPDARKAAQEAGVPNVYESFRELIEDDAVEVVDLLTQPDIREEVVRAAADAGKHIITEKPLTETAAEGECMVEAAREAGIRFAVHQNYRWRPMNFMARNIVKQGFVGAPFFVSIQIYGNQDVELKTHHFYAVCENFLPIQWGNHLADLMRYWTGRDAGRVLTRLGRMNGQNFVSDNLQLSITDFGAGLTGHVVHSELLRSSLSGVECRIDGDKGSVVFDFDTRLVVQSELLGVGPHTLDMTDIDYGGSFAGSMCDFLMAIEDDREPMVNAADNMTTIRTVLAEERSAQKGGVWINVTD